MADARDGETLSRALVELARRLDGGDPLHDEPATIFRPLDPALPATDPRSDVE